MKQQKSKWHCLWIVLAFLVFLSIFFMIDYKDRLANAQELQTLRKYRWANAIVYKVCIEGYQYTTFYMNGAGGITQDFKIKSWFPEGEKEQEKNCQMITG